jgi:hypothetical protein
MVDNIPAVKKKTLLNAIQSVLGNQQSPSDANCSIETLDEMDHFQCRNVE